MADRRLKDFLDMIAAEKGAAPNTVAAYRRDVLQFLAFFGRDCALAEEDDVAAFVRDLGSRGFAPRSMARKLSAVKEFYKFLYSEDEIKTNPAAGVLSPRQEKPLPKFLSAGEIKRLLLAAEEETDFAHCRLKAMLALMYACGLRVSELVALPVNCVNFEKGRFWFSAKVPRKDWCRRRRRRLRRLRNMRCGANGILTGANRRGCFLPTPRFPDM